MPRIAAMVPWDATSRLDARRIRQLVPAGDVGLLALRHALAFRQPGLWADDSRRPRTLLFVREGDGEVEAFGGGTPEPAVSWLAGLGRGVTLLAPTSWRRAVDAYVRNGTMGTVVTCVHTPSATIPASPGVATRRLTFQDEGAFLAITPEWALRGWVTFDALITHGAAFGVPHGDGFASLAWVFDQTDRFDALASFTAPRFRRLGLARASALALLGRVRCIWCKTPLWSASKDNGASLALATSLGFVPRSEQTVLRWPAQKPLNVVEGTGPSDMM